MKKNLLAIAIVFSSFVLSSHAQTEAGTKMLGGNAGFSFSKEKTKVGSITADGWRNYGFYLNPNAGLFIIDQLAVGGMVTIQSYGSSLKDGYQLGGGNAENMKSSSVSLAIGPWVRYYYPIGEKGAVFGELNTLLGVQQSKSSELDNGNVVMEKNPMHRLSQFGIGPGYSYFISDKVGLEGLLQYRVQRASHKDDGDEYRTKETTGGFYFNIGLQVYL